MRSTVRVSFRRSSSILFFNDTATTEIYTLSLHDALPICRPATRGLRPGHVVPGVAGAVFGLQDRSEEHTSELQSHVNLVWRLLLANKTRCINSFVVLVIRVVVVSLPSYCVVC